MSIAAVVRNGEVIFQNTYGTSATLQTNYRLASLTKQFTAMAVLMLKDVALDDRITRFLSSLPEHGITIRQLLTHTSGLVDYEDLVETTVPLKDADVLALLQRQPATLFAPGTQWRYSNGGYALLALIVEKVSGQRFGTFLRDNLFLPAGMMNTVAHEEGITIVSHRAYGQPQDQSVTSAVLGDGGIYSSVGDLSRWYAWLDANPLYPETVTPHVKTTDGWYGYGWYVGEQDGEPAVWHEGETAGFRNFVMRLTGPGLTVIILTNREDAVDPGPIRHQIRCLS